MGRGGGQVDSELAFYSNDPNSNPYIIVLEYFEVLISHHRDEIASLYIQYFAIFNNENFQSNNKFSIFGKMTPNLVTLILTDHSCPSWHFLRSLLYLFLSSIKKNKFFFAKQFINFQKRDTENTTNKSLHTFNKY